MCLSACLSVGNVCEPCKNELIEMLFGMLTRVGPGNRVLGEGAVPQLKGQFFGQEKWRPVVKYRNITMSRAETAEPIEMPFGVLTWMGPDEVQSPYKACKGHF